MGCLDEHTVVAFVTGRLSGAALGRAEKHLLACPSCTALVAVAAPVAPDGRPSRRPAIAAGTRVGGYRLLRLVGRGAVADVWAAQARDSKRKVAIKILRDDTYVDEIDSARLQREAQAIARLSHPNVISLYDVGTSDGRVFLAMELIEGETLAVWLERRQPSRDEILRVFVLAGRGLAAAHRAGIIHRDFKPQNVMVARDGDVRVMDFGLAARGPGGHADEPRLTAVGSILGTPVYMSPEQLRGQTVEPRADQYSFCVALYEALYGQRPFEGETFNALRAAVLAGRPRRPPLASDVPIRLRTVIFRGLASDREKRFPDMDALLAAIAASPRTGNRFPSRAVLAAAAAALTIGTGLAWRELRGSHKPPLCANGEARLTSAWPTQDAGARRRDMRAAFLATNVPDVPVHFERTARLLDSYAAAWRALAARCCGTSAPDGDRSRAARAACLDEKLVGLDALTEVLARGGGKTVRSAVAAVRSLPSVEACQDATGGAQPDDPVLRARVADMRAQLLRVRILAAVGHDREALQALGVLLEEVRTTWYKPLLAETLLVFGRVRAPSDPEAAVPLYEEAFEHSETTHNAASAAEAAIELTVIVGAIGHHFAVGERWSRLAEEHVDRGHQERLRSRMLDARGALHAARGRWHQAADDFGAAVASAEQTLGASHPHLATMLTNLSRADLLLERPEPALDAADRALAIARAIHPIDSFEVGTARLMRGRALASLTRLQEARPDLETALDALERTLGDEHPLTADPLTALGQLAMLERRPAYARSLLERAWTIRSTRVSDGGAREETAFWLARAIWEAAPADRRRAMTLANEAREGYATLPDLAPQLTVVDRWIDAHRAAAGPRWHPQPL